MICLPHACPAAGPLLAVAIMSAAMIGAAVSRRLATGIVLGLLTGGALSLIAATAGLLHVSPSAALVPVLAIASLSFAARGALFARSAADKGWWIAICVVAGEAAILFVAATTPGALPDWLLALLPAQWASAAIHAALTGTGAGAAGSELLALAGTAAATLLVARNWPSRWPYLVMFTTWIGLSVLVWYRPATPDVGHGALAPVEERAARAPLP